MNAPRPRRRPSVPASVTMGARCGRGRPIRCRRVLVPRCICGITRLGRRQHVGRLPSRHRGLRGLGRFGAGRRARGSRPSDPASLPRAPGPIGHQPADRGPEGLGASEVLLVVPAHGAGRHRSVDEPVSAARSLAPSSRPERRRARHRARSAPVCGRGRLRLAAPSATTPSSNCSTGAGFGSARCVA